VRATDAPRSLIIETSGRTGAVAIASGTELLSVQHLDEARRHARDLAPVMAALLTERGWGLRDLSATIVSLGPGSYTGLRVGIMSAKVLAYATGCVLIGVPTFSAVALQAPGTANQLDVIADAQQDKVYIQGFERSGVAWSATTPLRVTPFTDWLARRDATTWVTGPGLHRWKTHIPECARVAPETCWDPQPQSLLRFGIARYLAGESDDPYALEPLYLRPSSAEEQWHARGAR
jgi:tRNA threonylcarbamoyladenosine biosynthesis protein TsaB